jgi:creatinine amidohydrolase/Fe(II)-dependent formamide hydrolase-like protein
MKDIMRGLWATGFRKIIIVSGHGPESHIQVITHEAATELRREGKPLFIAGATYWELVAETLRGELTTPFYHSGEEEISNILWVRPDLVKIDAARGTELKPLIAKSLLKRSTTQDETETFQVYDISQVLPVPDPGELSTGGIGTTEEIRRASAEKGQKVLTRAVEHYLDLIRDIEQHYAPGEVPWIDVKERPAKPRFPVDY